MGISIPEEKITDSLITAYMKHRRGPEGDLIWQELFQELADILIKHGIVSPPKPVCEHWLSDEFPGDYESYCCTDGIRIDNDCELWEFCGYCGGKVEIIDCPEEFKCDE